MPRNVVNLRRSAPDLKQKENFLIFHEEGVLEEYLAWVRRVLDHQHATLERIDAKWTSEETIERASAFRAGARQHSAPFTSVWCVFESDRHVVNAEAAELAVKRRIQLATCTPSAEAWLKMHFTNLPTRDPAEAKDLQSHIPDYMGSLRNHENALFLKYDDASSRARSWEQQSSLSMNVYELIDAIRLSLQKSKGMQTLPRI